MAVRNDRQWTAGHLLERKATTVKVRASLKSLEARKGSVVVKPRGRVYVINPANPRWNGRQG